MIFEAIKGLPCQGDFTGYAVISEGRICAGTGRSDRDQNVRSVRIKSKERSVLSKADGRDSPDARKKEGMKTGWYGREKKRFLWMRSYSILLLV